MRAIAFAVAAVIVAATATAQRWQDVVGRTPAGIVALRQAVRDAGADATVLLVASHPDDRYFLPAIWLRQSFGYRVDVLLATRGGGGQNSLGAETGDALERIRTIETEAGCALAGIDAWYLDLPDAGYRRSAREAFLEWGREETLRAFVRLLRTIRPDAVMTTHYAGESHGHDRAIVEILPEAVARAADPDFATGDGAAAPPPHRVRRWFLGAGGELTRHAIEIDADQLDRDRGAALRRVAFDILRGAHLSPGPPASLESVFGPVMAFVEPDAPPGPPQPLVLPSLLDDGVWPGEPARARALDRLLRDDLPARVAAGDAPVDELAAALRELRLLRATLAGDLAARCERRIVALERLLLVLSGVQIEVEAPPGTVAVAGEEFACNVRILGAGGRDLPVRAEGVDGLEVTLDSVEPVGLRRSAVHAQAIVRVPLSSSADTDPMARRFRAPRFRPPVQIRFVVGFGGVDLPVVVTVPVEQHAPVELAVVPRMLLLPSARTTVQFSVGVTRNTQFPVEGDLEVRAPAGYVFDQQRYVLSLRDRRGDLFGFEVTAPAARKAGVDVLRIRLGENRISLPVHKIDVQVPPLLRIGVLRSRDDTLTSVLGVGGLGLGWSELTDADIAAADLRAYDTIVVDVRALRDRPDARRGFRRLLDFAAGRGRRLVLFYQKDVEFHPAGEAFLGAPFQPFQVGKNRVTRADAPVRVLRPDHLLLRHPNRIQPHDWDGWEQERALYLPAVYPDRYEELLELHDPDQPVERGALLYARTGDGEYVYCALSLWRQLKKLHPGAVRLLANLLTPAPPP